MPKTSPLIGAIAVLTLVLSSCAGGGNVEVAEEVYESCSRAGGDLIRLDGSDVLIEVLGADARSLGAAGDVDADDIAGGDLPDLGVAFSVVAGMSCLAEATGYPGSSDQLSDGEEWGGWTFSLRRGAGNEETSIFSATADAEAVEVERPRSGTGQQELHEALGCEGDLGAGDTGESGETVRICQERPAVVLLEFDSLDQKAEWVQFWEARGPVDDAFYVLGGGDERWGLWGLDPGFGDRAVAIGGEPVEFSTATD
ncbi:hypothetical protein C8046_05805 [Serinibacter arcticus]|uniref:Lipoprotein n=1 Tax=Serinibacter arcticus TaxID=1655435 RepID=A0A2U1ZTD9_9MICO|nr:hypothetical protein C8046_05805 [Serinibacter arcticus]